MSITLDMTDRATCVLFGDGAGVVYVEATTASNSGIIDTALYSDGSGAELLCIPAGGSRIPASHASVDQRLHYLHQDGQAVFKVAVTQMANVADAMLSKHKLQGSDLKFFIPHQANLRIIDACSKRLNLHSDQVVINLDQRGNTTAATIPTCLADIEAAGKLQRGDLLLLAAFGAGFTYGSALLRW